MMFEKLTEQSRKLQTITNHIGGRREFLTFFDTIRFCRYLHYLMKERNQNGRTKTSDCLLYSDVTVSAMLSVILLGMFWIFQIMSCLTLKVSCCRMVLTLVCHPGICAKKNLRRIWVTVGTAFTSQCQFCWTTHCFESPTRRPCSFV